MTESRPPGVNVPQSRSRVYSWWQRTSFNGDTSGAATGIYYYSERPTYNKGVVTTLAGGTKFRKSTDYSHESWELVPSGPYRMNGYLIQGPANFRQCISEREFDFLVKGAWDKFCNELNRQIPLEMKNECATKALNKIADQKVNLGENLATMGQTVRLLAGKSNTLLGALDSIWSNRSFRPYLAHSYRSLKREGLLNRISRNYLEYVYGLKPLCSDVYALVQLAKGQGSKSLLLKGTGKSARSYVSRESGWKSYTTYSGQKLYSSTANVSGKTVLWAQVDPNYSGLRALNQLGLLNPLGLAWDLVPYSFVVDWFLPVGSVFYALSAPAGLNFVDGSTSVRISQNSVFGYAYYGQGFPSDLVKTFESGERIPHVYEGFIRQRLTNWPIPGLWIDPDPFRSDRSLKALALAIQALGGRRTPHGY